MSERQTLTDRPDTPYMPTCYQLRANNA